MDRWSRLSHSDALISDQPAEESRDTCWNVRLCSDYEFLLAYIRIEYALTLTLSPHRTSPCFLSLA